MKNALILGLTLPLLLTRPARSAHFTTATSQSIREQWGEPIWTPGNVVPTEGNTYEAIGNGILYGANTANTRIRNPSATTGDPIIGVKTFPGDSLTLNANTDLRMKDPGNIVEFPGVDGKPGLILNGGAVGSGGGATPGLEGVIALAGKVSVVSASLIAMGDFGLGVPKPMRGLRIEASLVGAGPLIVLQGVTSLPCVDVVSTNNTFSGAWIVKAGYLKGRGFKSLGTGDIVLDGSTVVPAGLTDPATPLSNGPVLFEPDYDIDSPGALTLGFNAQMILHQNCRFGRVMIDGMVLPNGVYSYTSLVAAYPNSFLPGGSGSITANFGSNAITVTVQGQGSVAKDPDQGLYSLGQQVILTATPAPWFAFARWEDGVTSNPRGIIIGTRNHYAAIFSPATALETITISNVTRTAPVGMPAILVDGQFVVTGAVTRLGSAQVEMFTTFPNGTVLFTLDGAAPSLLSQIYTEPFLLRRSVTIRAAAWDANFTTSWEADPVQVVIEPTYRLNATTAGGGSIGMSPTDTRYSSNTEVTLVATPAPGWAFLQWLGDVAGASATNKVLMTRNKCVDAVFGTALSTATAGNGTVVMQPSAPLYPYGTVVRLTAIPEPGSTFALWGNAGSGTNNPLLYPVADSNRTVSAAFAALSAGQVALTLLTDGFGVVTSQPPGNRFGAGTTVLLTALPDPDQQFLGWNGDAGGLQNPLALLLNQSRVITARFTRRPRLSLPQCADTGPRSPLRPGPPVWLTGEWGAAYRIETAPNVEGPWETFMTLTNQFGRAQFLLPAPTNHEQFYRAVGE